MIKISVVMPVYNGAAFVGEAIRSVLYQTFRDFELIVVDDGSTDGTVQVIRGFDDERIVLLENDHDFIRALNTGLGAAKGKYIARMDADDMMHPQRLEMQYHLMEKRPDVAVCGTCMKTFGQSDEVLMLGDGYADPRSLLAGNIVAHPTTMLRKDFLQRHSLRYERYDWAEDYKLWCEIAGCGGRFYILPRVLLFYRMSPGQVTQKNAGQQAETVLKIRHEFLDRLIGESGEKRDGLLQLREALDNCRQKDILPEDLFFDVFENFFLKS